MHVEVQKESEYKHKYTLCAVALFIFKKLEQIWVSYSHIQQLNSLYYILVIWY